MTTVRKHTALDDVRAHAFALVSCSSWIRPGMLAHQLQLRSPRDLLGESQHFRRFSRRACGLPDRIGRFLPAARSTIQNGG